MLENSEQFEKDILEVRRMLAEAQKNEKIKEEENQPMEAEEPSLPAETLEPEEREEKPSGQEEEAKKVSVTWQQNLLLYLHDLIYLVAGLIVVSLLFLRIVVVSGTSMNVTLLDGDYMLVLSNLFYRNPQQGDVVVVSKQAYDNGTPIVKRVIATEGQMVDIDFELGIVYVDGVALDEPYTYTATTTRGGISFPLVVDEGCIFVLGDNRAVSRDSRSVDIGLIDEQEVLGKVVFLFLPGTNYGQFERDWTRIGGVS